MTAFRAEIIAFDGCDELDVIGPAEVLRMADIDAAIVTYQSRDYVTASHNVRIGVDGVYSNTADILVVPGGHWLYPDRPGVHAERAAGTIPDIVATSTSELILGVCTGVLLLAASGVLKGQSATTHSYALEDLQGTSDIDIQHQRVVDSGRIITCGGVTSGIDGALWLVERIHGRAIADKLTETLEYPRWSGDPRLARTD